MAGFGSRCAPSHARLADQSSFASACGSMGVPSAKAAAMSTRSAARASSSVSVAVHIANRNPPFPTYSRIVRATAFFRSGTVPNPSCRAAAPFRRTISASHGAPA